MWANGLLPNCPGFLLQDSALRIPLPLSSASPLWCHASASQFGQAMQQTVASLPITLHFCPFSLNLGICALFSFSSWNFSLNICFQFLLFCSPVDFFWGFLDPSFYFLHFIYIFEPFSRLPSAAVPCFKSSRGGTASMNEHPFLQRSRRFGGRGGWSKDQREGGIWAPQGTKGLKNLRTTFL